MVNTAGVLLVTLAITVVFIVTNPNYKRQPLPDEETIPLTNWLTCVCRRSGTVPCGCVLWHSAMWTFVVALCHVDVCCGTVLCEHVWSCDFTPSKTLFSFAKYVNVQKSCKIRNFSAIVYRSTCLLRINVEWSTNGSIYTVLDTASLETRSLWNEVSVPLLRSILQLMFFL